MTTGGPLNLPSRPGFCAAGQRRLCRHADRAALLAEDDEVSPLQRAQNWGNYRLIQAGRSSQPVARITLPPQDAYSPARRVYVDDVLSFSPAHGLADHRPLGSIMRARLKGYEPASRFRHEMNVQPRVEPRSVDEIPD